MDDLIAFLRARCDDLERAARNQSREDTNDKGRWVRECFTANALVAIQDPVRVLAEVEAKRRIIALYNLDFNDDGQPIYLGGYGEAYWDVLRLLALPFAGHPDYRESWKP